MDGHTNAISYGLVVAFSCRNMFALRGEVELGIHAMLSSTSSKRDLNLMSDSMDVT